MTAVLHVLYSRSVDRLHGLVDLQEGTAACERRRKERGMEKLWTRSKNLSQLSLLTVRALLASFRLKVGDAVHDDVVQEEGLVVDLDVA